MRARGSRDESEVEENWTSRPGWNNKGEGCTRQRVGTSVMACKGLERTQSDSDMVPQPAEFDRFSLEGYAVANVSTLSSHMVE